jgi:hypothetical protein
VYFFSHLSTAVFLNRKVFKGPDVAAASGVLLPDIVDKNLAWVLRITKSSHHIGHSLLGIASATACVRMMFGRDAARTFCAAYVLHLFEDEIHHGRVPWFFPFSSWKRVNHRPTRRRKILFASLELPALGLLTYCWHLDSIVKSRVMSLESE